MNGPIKRGDLIRRVRGHGDATPGAIGVVYDVIISTRRGVSAQRIVATFDGERNITKIAIAAEGTIWERLPADVVEIPDRIDTIRDRLVSERGAVE